MNNVRTNRSISSGASALTIAALLSMSFLLLAMVGLPSNNQTYNALQNFGHFAVFSVLAFLVLHQMWSLLRPNYIYAVVFSGILLIALGAVVEWYQAGIDGRTASIDDFILDITGIICGFLLLWALTRWWAGKRASALVIIAGLLLISLTIFKQSFFLLGFDLFKPPLPVLRTFDSTFSLAKLESIGGASYTRAAAPADVSADYVLRVGFSQQEYSGILFHEQSQRWSEYQGLRLDIFNPLPVIRQVELRINDIQHNNDYEDRYNGSFAISAGLNTIELPLAGVARMGRSTLETRKMNIDEVNHIQMFVHNSESEFVLDIVRIELFK